MDAKTIKKDFGRRLVQRLKEESMSRKELGERIGKSKSVISRWASGMHFPDRIEDLGPLADALNTTPGWLITGLDLPDEDREFIELFLSMPKAEKAALKLLAKPR